MLQTEFSDGLNDLNGWNVLNLGGAEQRGVSNASCS